jgi:ABC-type Fe3+ transport system permease subunit
MTLLYQTVESTQTIANSVSGDWSWLIVGIVLVVGAFLVFMILKNIVVNTILGLIGWGIATYLFHIQLPFWASLLVSAIFGLAGLGAMIVLAVLGIAK